MRTIYRFPEVSEEGHRAANNFSFWIAVCVAVLPVMINLVWGIYAGREEEVFRRGVTDLAFAGVIVAISTFSNTYFAYARLSGWKNMSWRTFASLLIVSVTAVFSFSAYLQVTHTKVAKGLLDDIFLLTAMNVLSCIVMSYVAHSSILADEFRNAREFLEDLTTREKRRS